jgi:hypothetical protein
LGWGLAGKIAPVAPPTAQPLGRILSPLHTTVPTALDLLPLGGDVLRPVRTVRGDKEWEAN